MSAIWASADLEKATGGIANGKWCAWRVEIDSRKVQPGDLFIALKGEHFDGHEYVAQAYAKGAIAAVVSRELPINGYQILVSDTQKALEDLAKYNRARSKAKIVGVTGSVGKTSTKEMLKLALSAHGKTYATNGNYNNHIGTPLNLANLPPDAEFAVFEMGMNHAGEISHLTRMVRPHIALVTGVYAVHLEFFSGVDEIAAAKAEIFEGLESGGIAVISADQPYFKNIAARKITFGEDNSSDFRLASYKATSTGSEISADINGKKLDYAIPTIGRHWAIISLSVLAVGEAMGLDMKKTASALAGFHEVSGRGNVTEIKVNGGSALLVNDSYNASPASMGAAFVKTAELWEARGKKGRKIALLGDMLELGESADLLHAGLADKLIEQGFDSVYTAGGLMESLHNALPPHLRAGHAQGAAELLQVVAGKIGGNDVVLVKGSHGSKLYEVAAMLENMAVDKEKESAL
jgi:UDP-N-acetylmuramoyl-tripeptide--D-alanyl-D-alanine ligase